jgi:hypothetical protein
MYAEKARPVLVYISTVHTVHNQRETGGIYMHIRPFNRNSSPTSDPHRIIYLPMCDSTYFLNFPVIYVVSVKSLCLYVVH